ncbi:MAG: hypothetical protein H6718_12195 [Polyangiaceae bacterium]|nr:hypothetical protein [Myxococcales bacterium]MCB9586153.1 hypothetical protein [Polyangiaceae bacterium]MCB9606830.1 hypothetical protein [Polyangiaceae bacterium]
MAERKRGTSTNGATFEALATTSVFLEDLRQRSLGDEARTGQVTDIG